MWKDTETNVDLLDFDYLTSTINELALNDNLTPSSIGIYGDWGCGKSSLMSMIESSFPDKSVLCIKFNGWLFEGYEDAKTALLGTILDEIARKRKLTKKAQGYLKALYERTDFIKLASKGTKLGLDLYFTGGIGTIADITLDQLKKRVGSVDPNIVAEDDVSSALREVLSSEKIRKDIKTFQSDFEKLLSETKLKRVVVFIDELDRCTPETILNTLEALRLFVFSKGMAFIIGADERQIQYAVKTKYPEIKGNHIDISKEYLEKLIQYPIRIPQLDSNQVQQYITCLFLEQELSADEYNEVKEIIKEGKQNNLLDFQLSASVIAEKKPRLEDKTKDVLILSKQISSVLAKGLNGNPRHCKRFLNALSLRMTMARYKNKELDRKILAKVMLIEYFKEGFYRVLASQLTKEGRFDELVRIEENNWDDLAKFKMWENDQWIKDWINIEPKLGDKDLRLYFYFSRESLKNNSILSSILTPKSEKILENLLSKSDSLCISALKEISTISEAEIVEVHKTIFSRIEIESEVNSELFKTFVEVSKSREILFSDTLSMIDSLPLKTIKLSIIPYFSDFIKVLPNKTKGIEMLIRWKNEKNSLTSAIDKEITTLRIL